MSNDRPSRKAPSDDRNTYLAYSRVDNNLATLKLFVIWMSKSAYVTGTIDGLNIAPKIVILIEGARETSVYELECPSSVEWANSHSTTRNFSERSKNQTMNHIASEKSDPLGTAICLCINLRNRTGFYNVSYCDQPMQSRVVL
jgi:hypothetical protein